MKKRFLVALALLLPGLAVADEMRLDQVVAHASRDLVGPRAGFEDASLTELVQRAMLEATGADAALSAPLAGGARIGKGAVTVSDLFRLCPGELRVFTSTLSGRQIRDLLERTASRFLAYTYQDGPPLLEPGATDSLIDALEGLSYEIDLTRPEGDRVIHLSFRGAALDTGRFLRVVMDERRAMRHDFEFVPGGPRQEIVWLKDALLAHVRQLGTLDGSFDHNWSVLPDYATTPERPLIDRLVRLGAAPREEVHRLFPDQPALRGDLAYWLARAFGWREAKPSGAFPDLPDSLEPWLDGLVKHRVLDVATGTSEFFRPFAAATLPLAFEWCEKAGRASGYALDTPEESRSFRRGLLTGSSLGTSAERMTSDTLTRAQVLGIIANLRFPTIRVIETTDFHGAMLPRRSGGRALGGSATLAAHLGRLRAENPEGTVLLDGGDLFQGTMVSNLTFGRPVVEQMNRLGYTAVAIGNHDFDWSADTLARRVHEMGFAALGANLLDRRSHRRPPWARSDTAFTRRGVRVGVFGLCYPATPSVTRPRNVAAFRFDDDSATAIALVPRLRKRHGVELVIGLGHIPGTTNSAGGVGGDIARLARGVRGVDLWLGGHSHTRVAGEIGGVPVLVPGSHGEEVALCDLVVDPARDRVVEKRFRLVPTWADEVQPDTAMQTVVERWNRELAPIAHTEIGRSARPLTRSHGGESPVGSLVADVIREVLRVDIALQNNDGLRADLPQGAITLGASYEVLPFGNALVTMELTGAEVRRTLEEGLANERITQVSGIRYRFDLGAPAGARLTALQAADGTPLDEAKTYRVGCNDFMAEGGDDYLTLTRGRSMRDSGMGLREAFEEFIRRRCANGGTLDYAGDGRVTREPGSRPPARGE